MRKLFFVVTLLIAAMVSQISLAKVTDVYTFSSVQQEERFNKLIQQLRCVVCQNQSLAESNAPLAKDLRNEVFLKIQQNYSDEAIRKILVSRYGEYILLKPILKNNTYILWIGPFVFLLLGFVILYCSVKRQQSVEVR